MWRVPRGSAASVEALGDEFDRPDVVAAVPEHPAERVVEMVYVGAAETAPVSDDPSEFERHLGHEAERAAVRGLRKPNIVAVEFGECVGGKSFRAEFSLDRVDEVVAERAEIRYLYAHPEDREQSAGLGEQETLLPLDPNEVQVPVIVARRELAEGELAAAEQIEHLLRAPHDHRSNLPATPSGSGCGLVFVDQPAEQIVAARVKRQGGSRDRRRPIRRRQPKRAMRPMRVVVPHIDGKDPLKMSATDDQKMVEAIGAHGSHPALRVGVRVRRPHRRPDHPDTLGTEDLVESAAELRVAVMDQEPERLLLSELHHQVARLLRRPSPVRVRAAGDVLDPSRRERDEKQHVDPLQERRLNGQEVASEGGRRLLPQKRPPRQASALRRRRPPASISTVRTVVGETATPSPLSSPTIRRYPQRGFSLARRRINAATEGWSGGRPC